jgi:tetratricopeptide (TPR) repeat protein
MVALLKTLQSVANDFRPKHGRPRAASFITLAQSHNFAFRAAVLVLLVSITTLLGITLWQAHNKSAIDNAVAPTTALQPPTAKIIVKLEHDDKPQKLPTKLPLPVASAPAANDTYDIVLPAESLSDDEQASMAPTSSDSDPAIEVVAEKISDLPALHDVTSQKNPVQTVTFHPGQAVTEDQILSDAHALLMSGDDPAALALYGQVLKRDKTSRAALEGKMFVLQRMGQGAQAVEVGHRLIEIDPDNATAQANLVTALGQSALPASMKELEKRVAANPGDAPAQVALAKLLAHRGYFDKAFAHLNSAIKSAPNNISYRLALAVLYDSAGYPNDAVLLYRQVLRAAMNEDDPSQLPLSLNAVRQRMTYLETSSQADQH